MLDAPANLAPLSQIFSQTPLSKPLRKRLGFTVEQLSHNPQASLPEALGDTGYKGLMRALKDPKVKEEILFDAVYQATLERMVPGEDILCIEDTTDLTFGGKRGRVGLPRLEGKATGFRAHVALAVRPGKVRTVLGVLDLRQIVRPEQSKSNQSARERYEDPEKESLRWSQTVEATEQRVAGRASLIHVRDREGDDYEQLLTMGRADKPQRFVQRMRQPRLLAEAPAANPTARKVDDAFEGVRGICERNVNLSARAQGKFDQRTKEDKKIYPARQYRVARLQFAAQTLLIRRPDNASKDLPASLELNVVHVVEIDPPAGEEGVEWYLFTGEPIDTVDSVLRVVDIYCTRWLIEEFNKALKTGCTFEKLQCETVERLWAMLALYAPIAAELLALRTLAHNDTEHSASDVLGREELEVLQAGRPSKSKKSSALTVRDALLLIARMGGHFRSNGDPGWLVLLRGMVKLREQVFGFRLARTLLTEQSSTKDAPS